MLIFLTIILGYLLGSVKIMGLQMGNSFVLIVALVFGHFGFEIPPIIGQLGLISFIAAVGLIAGPTFFRNFKNKILEYITLGALVVLLGAIICIAIIKIFNIPTALAIGLFSGALTSTPGLAATIEATGDAMASIGYGIAYPFGVVGVVLFIQLVPKLTRIDMKYETDKLNGDLGVSNNEYNGDDNSHSESLGFLPYAIAIFSGLFLAKLNVPLPGGVNFSLGTSGGPLLTGLLMGHFKNSNRKLFAIPKATLEIMREFGLMLFLMDAGLTAGRGFIEILQEYGLLLFILGTVLTLVPMILGYFIGRYLLKLDVLSTLGATCGAMTSTPALGTLISVSKTDTVATFYAATYPIALVFMILVSRILSIFF